MDYKNRYLYILHFTDSLGFNYCKIGISKDVESRRKQLQTNIDFNLKIIYEKYLEDVRNFENDLKQRFKEKNVKYYVFGKQNPVKKLLPNNTEWYHLSKSEVQGIKETLSKYSFEKTIVKERKKLGFKSSNNKTYISKKQIRGKSYYKLSFIQYKCILEVLESGKTRAKERDFLKNICKRFNSNNILTEKQYKYTKLLAYKYN